MPKQSADYWPDSKCAKAFWGQYRLRPYKKLLVETQEQLDPKPGQRWLDLGCGRGMCTRALWEKSGGTVSEIVGLDVAAVNVEVYNQLNFSLTPRPRPGQLRFVAADFSDLSKWPAASFDGVVSGLAITYANSYSEKLGRWTSEAYDLALSNVARLLKPGGQFVFSVNVPEPAWSRIALSTMMGSFSTWRPDLLFVKALQICSYGGWLKREARRGRFQYLPIQIVKSKLEALGLGEAEHKVSFAGCAYLINCRKTAMTMLRAA
ncbi:MAG: class I SAM-dependent methyltransferase [Gemmataceae bacterium]